MKQAENSGGATVAVRSVRARVAILAVAQRVPATVFLPSRNA